MPTFVNLSDIAKAFTKHFATVAMDIKFPLKFLRKKHFQYLSARNVKYIRSLISFPIGLRLIDQSIMPQKL